MSTTTVGSERLVKVSAETLARLERLAAEWATSVEGVILMAVDTVFYEIPEGRHPMACPDPTPEEEAADAASLTRALGVQKSSPSQPIDVATFRGRTSP